MRKITLASIVLAAFGVFVLPPSPAQSGETWVSGTGSNGNDCLTPATPCREFNGATGALAKTGLGGTIIVLPGNYLAVDITQSVQIIADGGQASIIGSATGTSADVAGGIFVNAGPNDVVRIRGMIVNQLGSIPGNGVSFVAGKALHLENCTLIGTSFGHFGLLFVPNAAAAGGVPTELTVRNSTIGSNPIGNVLIKPSSAVAVAALFDGVWVGDGLFGVKADNSGGSGKITVDFVQSVAKGNANNGLIAVGTGASPVHFMIDRSTADNNGAFGAVASGAQAFMIVTGSTLMRNGTGLAQQAGSTVATLSNNTINFNTTNTSGTITPITLK